MKGRVSVSCPPIINTMAVAVAANEHKRKISAGFIRSDGRYGIYAEPCPSYIASNVTLIGELRAVYIGLKGVHSQSTDIVCGSANTIGFLTKWLDGDLRYPEGYLLERNPSHKSSLERLALLLSTHPQRYSAESAVNDAERFFLKTATALAKLGLRTLSRDKLAIGAIECKHRAQRLAQDTLSRDS